MTTATRNEAEERLPTLEVREYALRPGSFYIAVDGDEGRWVIDDCALAERIVAAYNQRDLALAAERRAGRLQALGECMCEKCEPEWTAAILDEEAARA